MSAAIEPDSAEFFNQVADLRTDFAVTTGLPDPDDAQQVRDWMLRLRAGGNATAEAMSLHEYIGSLMGLFNLACWAAIANGEQSSLAENLHLGEQAIRRAADRAAFEIETLDLDAQGGQSPAWDPELPAAAAVIQPALRRAGEGVRHG